MVKRKRVKKAKKDKIPFWKKFGPEVKHVTDHVGQIVNNSKVADFSALFMNAGLALAGFQVFQSWQGALWGPVSLKLATSENLAAGIAGVAGLATLGLASGSAGLQNFIADPWGAIQEDTEHLLAGDPVYDEPIEGVCSGGKLLMQRQGVQICVDPWRVLGMNRWGWSRVQNGGIPSPPAPPSNGNGGNGPPAPTFPLDQIDSIAAGYHCYRVPSSDPNYLYVWDCAGFEGANFLLQEVSQTLNVSLVALPPTGDVYPVAYSVWPALP